MKRISCLKFGCCMFICILCAIPSITYGWLEIAHCALGENTGTGAGYNTIPDYWQSYDVSRLLSLDPYFLWAHECKVTTPGGLGRKVVPSYNKAIGAEDDSPGSYFGALVTKIDTSRVTPSVLHIIRGWKAHNAADHEVHWSFFIGATNALSAADWKQHIPREMAADIFVYVTILFHDRLDLAFDAKGKAVGHNFSTACGDTNSDAFLCLAQKVFRKKQATLDATDMWGLNVQSAKEIGQLRTAIGREYLDPKVMFNFTLEGYRRAQLKQHDVWINWRRYFDASQAAIQRLP